MGRAKSSLSDVARRWNRSPIPTGPMLSSDEEGRRPSGVLSGGIIVALMVMLGGIVWVWKSSPAPASAARDGASVASVAASETVASAREMMASGQWSRAENLLIPAAVKYPEDQAVRIARAECLAALKRYAESYTQYEKALAIGPRDASIEFGAGVAARESGNLERALEHLSMAQTADPQNPDFAVALAQTQRKTGSIEACKANLLRAAHLDPDNAFIWGTLADIALSENNTGVSLQHVSKARTLQPDSTEWRLIEARAHKRRGEPDKALRVLGAIEARQRKEPAVARLISECYGMQGHPADAATIMGEAFLASPMDGSLAYDAAVAFERAGNREKAVEYARYSKALGNESAVKLLAKLAG